MEKSKQILMLVKIGQKDHIEQLQKSGLIYANTVGYFRQMKGEDFLRKDIREGAFNHIPLRQGDTLAISVNNKTIPFQISRGHINEYYTYMKKLNLYCMMHFDPQDVNKTGIIDKRNIEFGDTSLFITNPKKFIDRIKDNAPDFVKTFYGPIRYYDVNKKYEDLTIFDKPDHFDFQKEFRFVFHGHGNGPLRFEIGSLKDISYMVEADKLTTVEIKYLSHTA